ncbi:MAG: uroporphyrinogen-III C-methyltransferase [Synergistaceae bacterium]|nr:uroporphyrinogen-III C-methyltransferase [Synergistaceae bacterium]
MNGKVWLVGAGPGDPELLTLKGKRVLEQADVVVYDRLIGPGVLGYAPPEAELIDVGKSGGRHPVPQGEIEGILIEKALEGKRVVRLKGGDPFLFGRGGEEMTALTDRGIPCEPVSGVTSAIAVPASAGIPVTHRDYASSLHIVTAHKRWDAPLDYDALARLEGTLVFLMGASEVGEICERLIAAGMDKNTPAAVIERGTTARQRRVTGVLANLARAARDDRSPGVQPPAVVVVGRVVALAETLDWRARLPLTGRRVLVPLPASRGKNGGRLTALLRSRGAEVLETLSSRTEAIDAPLPHLGGYEWLVFTSAAGVEFFFERLRADRRDIREIDAAKIAAVGSATKDVIESRGLRVDLIPSVYSGSALGKALRTVLESPLSAGSKRLLLLRAERGAPDLARILREGGLDFDEVPLYRTVPIVSGDDRREDADLGDVTAAFTCASSVRGFAASYPDVRVRAVCIGEQTEKAARESGYETRVARKATLEDLADAVEEVFRLAK